MKKKEYTGYNEKKKTSTVCYNPSTVVGFFQLESRLIIYILTFLVNGYWIFFEKL